MTAGKHKLLSLIEKAFPSQPASCYFRLCEHNANIAECKLSVSRVQKYVIRNIGGAQQHIVEQVKTLRVN